MKKESSEEYQFVNLKEFKMYFDIISQDGLFKLKYKRARNFIRIKIPFKLDENVASLAGLMPDGSLIRDLMRIYFHQKKDFSKILLFGGLIKKLFLPNNKVFITDDRGTTKTYINSQALAIFFYKIIGIPKSDEQMRIPKWIFNSPKTVKIAYLKEAYAMEGTILKKLTEIRFITKDRLFAYDIKRLLLQIGIESHVKPRMGGLHNDSPQYRISIYRLKNFELFKEIGFSTKFHKERFEKIFKIAGRSSP
jgi:intein/homing endonuclease